MNAQIYKIKLNNFLKHNKNPRKSYTHFMVSKAIFSDEKVAQLTPNEFKLFLYCIAIASETASEWIQISFKMLPKHFRIGEQMMSKCLSSLQSFQLVTVEKNDSFKSEEKRMEGNGREVKRSTSEVKVPKVEKTPELNKKIWESYRQEYLLRHKVEPVRNASVNAKVSQLAKRLGEEAIDVVRFYIWHNDRFYLKNMHDIGLCLKDCESLRTQWLRGTQVTSQTVRNFEKTSNLVTLMEDAKKGGF